MHIADNWHKRIMQIDFLGTSSQGELFIKELMKKTKQISIFTLRFTKNVPPLRKKIELSTLNEVK